MPYIVHEGLDYIALLADDETTDRPSATFSDRALADKVAWLLNAPQTRTVITIEQMVTREVLCCMSSAVSVLAKNYGNSLSATDYRKSDDMRELANVVEEAFELARPIDDFQEAAEQEGWSGPLEDDFGATYFSNKDGTTWACANWEALCSDHDIEPYEWEVFEHWAVSTWFAEKLKEQGEKVDDDFCGLNVWARTTTGQGIASDGVVERIYAATIAA
ncbi:hypothetical protein [Bradyrhizobium sp. WSM3983]|uniref:hypothetical protein n=1 Tax=Bradyrhizobium sp. WSM3983 TaxID=1038867 RepID=UPI00041D1D76|nr:hypothetical protein [Bradyrhizobium sp. WSM3983]